MILSINCTTWESTSTPAKKTSGRVTDLHISEIVFAINSHMSQEGTGSNNDRFLGRSVRSGLPTSVDPSLDTEKLIHKRIMNHDK